MAYVNDWSKLVSTTTSTQPSILTFNDLKKAIQEVEGMAGPCCQYAYYGYPCKCAYKKLQSRSLNMYLGADWAYEKKEKEMSVADKLKRLAMNKDDRLLVDYKIVDDNGDLTCDGKDVLWTVLFEKHKTELVAKVRELDEEEKSKKKTKK